MIALNTGIQKITYGSDSIGYVYSGTDLIFPTGPVNSTGFLKYDASNIKREFKTSYIVDPNAPFQVMFVYSNNKNDYISTKFLGPDTGDVDVAVGKDQFMNYENGTFYTQFNAFVSTGEYDQDLLYNAGNMITEFLEGLPGDENAEWDQYFVYTGTSLRNGFLGPDSGDIDVPVGKDQWMNYENGTFVTQFIYFVDTGEFDQNLLYDSSNIVTEFIGHAEPNPGTEWDQNFFCTGSCFKTMFLGPDTEDIDVVSGKDQFMNYENGTFYWEFNQFAPTGELDQTLLYDAGNIVTEFKGPVFVGSGTYDQYLAAPTFLGPDAGDEDVVSGKDQYMWYNNGNFVVTFVGPAITGIYDQDLAYVESNIATYFID